MEEYYGYDSLMRDVDKLSAHTGVWSGVLCKSVLGREIPIFHMGCGESKVLYIGAHHGMEHISSAMLMDFLLSLAEDGKTLEQVSFTVIPMLNPDGVTVSISGPLEAVSTCVCGRKERLRTITEAIRRYCRRKDICVPEPDAAFTPWQANANGVDLNHNYDCGFNEYKAVESELGITAPYPTLFSGECPESEPESRAVCDLIRGESYDLMLTFHSQGMELYGDDPAATALRAGKRSEYIPYGKRIEALSGYSLAKPAGTARFGGLTDWYLEKLCRPAYTVELGIGENPLSLSCLPVIRKQMKQVLLYLPLTS